MTRKELYNKIKCLDLGKEVKKVFGDNFTRVSNADLERLITCKEKTLKKAASACNKAKYATTAKKATPTEPDFKDTIIRIVSVLQGSQIIGKDDAAFILANF